MRDREPPDPGEIARRLLDQDLADPNDPVRVAEAGESVCRKLHTHVAPLIGLAGFQSVLSHAVRRESGRHSLLKGLQMGSGDGPCLSGLSEQTEGADPAQVRAALVALFSSFVGLLISLLGRDLTSTLLRRVLPDL